MYQAGQMVIYNGNQPENEGWELSEEVIEMGRLTVGKAYVILSVEQSRHRTTQDIYLMDNKGKKWGVSANSVSPIRRTFQRNLPSWF